MSSNFSTGLMVSVVGLTITFSALLIFIGVIMLLKILFPYKEEKEEPVTTISSENDEEITAAIAAVAYLQGRHSNQLGSALMDGKSPFWTAN